MKATPLRVKRTNRIGPNGAATKTPPLLSSAQVAEMLGIPEGTLRYWRKTGVGPAWIKMEGTIRYDLADVQAYVERNRRIPSVRAYMEERDVSL